MPDCPPWCSDTAHVVGWDVRADSGLPVRTHASEVRGGGEPFYGYVFAEELLTPDGVTTSPARVEAGVEDFDEGRRLDGLTAEQARAFARVLQEAADECDRVNAHLGGRQ